MRYPTLACWVSLVVVLACGPSSPPTTPGAPPAVVPSTAGTAPTAALAAPTAANVPPVPTAAVTAAVMPRPLDPLVVVRVGLLSSVSDSGVYIGYERGYYRELGLDLQLETVPDPNTISTLVGTNQLDVGGFGINANPFQAAARGVGVKMVADKGSLRPGFGYAALLARQDLVESGQIRSLADVRKRTITKLAPCDSSDPWF